MALFLLSLSFFKRYRFFIEIFIFWIVAVILSGKYFRKIRDFFPLPEIGTNKIIGYSQYFGYPFYFDTIFFNILIFLPLLILIIIFLRHKMVCKVKNKE